MNCPIIFYMEDGKIIDQGSYRELLQRNEKFREMAKEKQQGTMNNEQRTMNNEQ
jgi:ABC-type multidrug transport system fused ATPase/permease subunit